VTAVPPIDTMSLRSSRAVQCAVLALGVALLRLTDPDHPLPIDLCAFKAFTGVPCPACGLTRAVCHALRGDWAMSISYHPAGVLVAAGLVAWMLWSVAEAVRGRSLATNVRDRVSISLVSAGAVLSVVSWIARFALGTWTPI
jgi:hypothetical protein